MLSILQAAGWPVWFLILTSFIGLALIIERAVVLRQARVAPPALLGQLITLLQARGVSPDAIQKLEADSPLGRILAAGVRNSRAGRSAMQEAMESAAQNVTHELERYLGALSTVAAVAPLLGLFGTVIGMIEIFGAASPSGSSPQALAHGISVALYNTALGLAIAIPALVAARFYRTRVEGFMLQMQTQAQRLLEILAPV
ncbi:MAG: MotA/TolQ/ExbB proton channel family protein [Burkholderiaceae bacterium]